MFIWQHLHYVTITSTVTVRMSFHGFKNQLLEIHIKEKTHCGEMEKGNFLLPRLE